MIRVNIGGLRPHAAEDVLIEDNQRLTDDLYVVGRALVSPTEIHIKDKTKIAWATPATYRNVQVLAVHHHHPDWSAYTSTSAVPRKPDWEARLPHFPVSPIPRNVNIAAEIDLSASALCEEQKQQLRTYYATIRMRLSDRMGISDITTEASGTASSTTHPHHHERYTKRAVNAWRFTIDFREFNAITRPQQSILPNIQDIIDLCANQCLYTSLDFQQGFHQIPLEDSHCKRTAFACFLGAFEYIRMPMGLKGAPVTFQRIMNDCKKHLRARVFIYIDNFIITSETAEDHLRDIDEVLTKIRDIGMKLEATKCEFARKEIKFFMDSLLSTSHHPTPHNTITGRSRPEDIVLDVSLIKLVLTHLSMRLPRHLHLHYPLVRVPNAAIVQPQPDDDADQHEVHDKRDRRNRVLTPNRPQITASKTPHQVIHSSTAPGPTAAMVDIE
ncbi:unnamed protein product [Heligmosomoides polygyrus]|uniref:Reverse transcriptase domain-containing protein n=1 Tax=Heligmosomoides polygyrus TaxID=6339 RepID=A0A183GEP7_HELPZ|nr:unnamed protein product [Heligmosomoides polygyrus]